MKLALAVLPAFLLVAAGPAFAKHHHKHHKHHSTGASAPGDASGGKPPGAGENTPTATGGQPGGGAGKP